MHETGHWGYCDETSIGNCPITYKNIDAMVRALSEYQKVLEISDQLRHQMKVGNVNSVKSDDSRKHDS